MPSPPLYIQIRICRLREVKHLAQGNTVNKQWHRYLNLVISRWPHLQRGIRWISGSWAWVCSFGATGSRIWVTLLGHLYGDFATGWNLTGLGAPVLKVNKVRWAVSQALELHPKYLNKKSPSWQPLAHFSPVRLSLALNISHLTIAPASALPFRLTF